MPQGLSIPLHNTLNYFQLFAGGIKKNIYSVPTQKAHKITEVINLQIADDANIYIACNSKIVP